MNVILKIFYVLLCLDRNILNLINQLKYLFSYA